MRFQALGFHCHVSADESLKQFVGFFVSGGVDHQPLIHGIDPGAERAAAAQRLRHQFFEHALADVTHLLATDRMFLFFR